MSKTHDELAALFRYMTPEMLAAYETGLPSFGIKIVQDPIEFGLPWDTMLGPQPVRVMITTMPDAAQEQEGRSQDANETAQIEEYEKSFAA